MKAANRRDRKMESGLTRRGLLEGAGAASAFLILPRRLLGGPGHVPPSGRLNLAFIGTGSQGLRVMFGFLRQPDVQAVAVCDPNRQSGDYPQWGAGEFCKSVRQLLGTDSGWEWLSPDGPIELTRTLKVTGGTCGREPARKIVDAFYGKQNETGGFKGCAAYADFRELLEKEKDADAVVAGTTDHWHAFVSVAAMKKGKHVYCQKPMTRTVYEARRMAEVARETGVATQVAVVNQASESTRLLCEMVWAGAIGPVRRVVNWSSRPFWPQGVDRPAETPPVPEGLDWDLWLGPSPERPYHHIYHPFNWRGWHDFGGGAIGDMGCYSFDTIFRVLKLEAPDTVEASSSETAAEAYPKACIMHFTFPARGDRPPVKVTWYDGGLRPPCPEDLGPREKMRSEGLLFVGDQGSILCGFNGSNPVLLPESRRRDFEPPPKTLPRSPGHDREWIDACKGGKDAPGANFVFTGPVTETIMLGNAALRAGERLAWDRENLKAVNSTAAQRHIRPEYRAGWSL